MKGLRAKSGHDFSAAVVTKGHWVCLGLLSCHHQGTGVGEHQDYPPLPQGSPCCPKGVDKGTGTEHGMEFRPSGLMEETGGSMTQLGKGTPPKAIQQGLAGILPGLGLEDTAILAPSFRDHTASHSSPSPWPPPEWLCTSSSHADSGSFLSPATTATTWKPCIHLWPGHSRLGPSVLPSQQCPALHQPPFPSSGPSQELV